MEEETKQSSFTGWAVVEMMGHRKAIGFVTTEAYGAAVLFRVDTPELPEREYLLTKPEYIDGGGWTPTGSKVKRAGVPARTCLIAPGSLYAMNPCTEEAARTAMEHSINRPLILIEAPPTKALAAGSGPTDATGEYDGDEYEADEEEFWGII